jgi:hypothetical protein
MENSTEKKEYVRPRNVNLAFRVSEEEREMIERRMAQSGMENMRAYLVKMAIDGRVIRVELESVREMVRLLSNATNNINQLVADEYPAGIVRDIFRMKIDGVSALKIAEHLNAHGVLSPLEYKKDRGLPYPKRGFADKAEAKWSATTVIRILGDETYTGVLIQGRQGTLNYKLKDLIDKPEAEWKRTENAHEAIIAKHDFDLAQKIMRLDTRTTPGGDKVYIFSGVLICGSCGNRMTQLTVTLLFIANRQ